MLDNLLFNIKKSRVFVFLCLLFLSSIQGRIDYVRGSYSSNTFNRIG